MKKRTIAFLLVIGLSGVILGSLIIRDQKLKSAFAHVATGTSQTEVIQVLGEPYAVVECASFGGTPPLGCTKEFSYISLATLWDVWVLSFDANDRVIRKLRYRSP